MSENKSLTIECKAKIVSLIEIYMPNIRNRILPTIMKTQINHLRSGRKNQILNELVDYSKLPQATSHIGHSGSNSIDVESVWDKVISENRKEMVIKINGLEFILTANLSISGKSVFYSCDISKEVLEKLFYVNPSNKSTPYIHISNSNIIEVSNGKNSYRYVCPSLIEII